MARPPVNGSIVTNFGNAVKPWAPCPRYDGGLYRRGQTRMVVSRGLGNSLFPLRVGNRPEVVVATLHSAPSVEGQ